MEDRYTLKTDAGYSIRQINHTFRQKCPFLTVHVVWQNKINVFKQHHHDPSFRDADDGAVLHEHLGPG